MGGVPDLLSHAEALGALPALLGEVMLAVKLPSMKAREAAYDALAEVGRKMMAHGKKAGGAAAAPSVSPMAAGMGDGSQALMTEYVCMLLAGLAGTSPHMRSAAVLALAKIIYEFRRELQQTVISAILNTVLPLLQSKAREIIKAVLGFVKVASLTLNAEALRPHLKEMIAGVTLFSDDTKNRFKQKTKVIFEILVRKYGEETVKALVPAEYSKLIGYIRKQSDREKRQKQEARRKKLEDSAARAEQEGTTAGRQMKFADYESMLHDSDEDDKDDVEMAADEAKKAASKKVARKNEGDRFGTRSAKNRAEKAPKLKDSGADKLRLTAEDVDFMGDEVAKHIVPDKKVRKFVAKKGVEENSEGKLVITDDMADEMSKSDKKEKRIDLEDIKKQLKAESKVNRKRKADEEDVVADSNRRNVSGKQFKVRFCANFCLICFV
jgi:ribosomal RNA-processing protein 12